MGGNILSGALMVLSVLIVNLLVAFMISDSTTTDPIPGCQTSDNYTTCQSVSTTTFAHAFISASLGDLGDAPAIIGAAYALILGAILVIGVVLIVLGIASVPFGGG